MNMNESRNFDGDVAEHFTAMLTTAMGTSHHWIRKFVQNFTQRYIVHRTVRTAGVDDWSERFEAAIRDVPCSNSTNEVRHLPTFAMALTITLFRYQLSE